MCWFDCRIGSEKSIPKSLVTNSQFVYLCAVLILRDVPSMVLACDLCSHDYLSQGGNLCANWDIKREGASNKDNIVTNVRTSSIPWEYWMTHERPYMHPILLNMMLLDYIDSILTPRVVCVDFTADRHRPKKRLVTLDQTRMAHVFVPKRGFVTCDCETAEEAIEHFKKHVAWLLSTNWDVTLGGWKPFF